MTYQPRWQPREDGATVHREGWVLTPATLVGHEYATTLLAPDGGVVAELRRDGRGWWRHGWLPPSFAGGFATAQAAADDLIERATHRRVGNPLGPGRHADEPDVRRWEGEGGR